jgi:hypothetical protein
LQAALWGITGASLQAAQLMLVSKVITFPFELVFAFHEENHRLSLCTLTSGKVNINKS